MRLALRAARSLAAAATTISALLIFPTAAAYSFNTTAPLQCQDWTVTWDGGVAPFYLTLVPTMEMTGGRIQNISLDIGSQTAPPYSASLQVGLPSGLTFVAALSDATGFGTGGVTAVKTIGPSQDVSCLIMETHADFTFWTEPRDSPPQCSPMRVVWGDGVKSNATYPIGLLGIVPGGNAWEIPVSQTPNKLTVNWTVNMEYGTQFMLLMTDAGKYGTGGSTVPLTVQYSSDKSCINEESPRTTVTSSPDQTGTPRPTPSKPASKGTNIGAIVGGVVGGVVALILLALLIFCLMRRRKRAREQYGGARYSHPQATTAQPFEIDEFEETPPPPHELQPYTYSPPLTAAASSEPGMSARREKERLAAGLHGPGRMSRDSGPSSSGPTDGEDLYTLSELASALAASGRPVNRDELIDVLAPPPSYDPTSDSSTVPDVRHSMFTDRSIPISDGEAPLVPDTASTHFRGDSMSTSAGPPPPQLPHSPHSPHSPSAHPAP